MSYLFEASVFDLCLPIQLLMGRDIPDTTFCGKKIVGDV
jgi:hypothetical protein